MLISLSSARGSGMAFQLMLLLMQSYYVIHCECRVHGKECIAVCDCDNEYILCISYSNCYKIQEALFNVGLHVNLITLAHLSYFQTKFSDEYGCCNPNTNTEEPRLKTRRASIWRILKRRIWRMRG